MPAKSGSQKATASISIPPEGDDFVGPFLSWSNIGWLSRVRCLWLSHWLFWGLPKDRIGAAPRRTPAFRFRFKAMSSSDRFRAGPT